ncbi:MAG: glycosyltransferase family 4 protein [Bacteroidetes bacterium]|nr:glycosyltransferase family 4 protein [Bacteroidota bacterium]
MKIAQVVKALPSSFGGGIQTHAWSLAMELVNSGHQVTFITSSRLDPGQLYSISSVRIPLFISQKSRLLAWIGDIIFNVSAFFVVLTRSARWDVIHTHGRSGLFNSFLPFFIRKKVVTSFHSLTSDEIRFLSDVQVLEKVILNAFILPAEKRLVRKALHPISVSKFLSSVLQKGKPRSTFSVIPNGIDLTSFGSPVSSSLNQRWLCVARLEAIKGLDLLIRALPFFPGTTLTLAGDGPKKEVLKKLALEIGVAERVYFAGRISSSQIASIYRSHGLFLFPTRYESQGIVVLEACRFGLPVIASNIPAISEVILNESNGLLFEMDNLHDLVGKINQFYEEPESKTNKKILSFQSHLAVNYSLVTMTRKVLECYRSI